MVVYLRVVMVVYLRHRSYASTCRRGRVSARRRRDRAPAPSSWSCIYLAVMVVHLRAVMVVVHLRDRRGRTSTRHRGDRVFTRQFCPSG